jgi:outer membrane protein OmpA-like peptidoglycan-associated protein
MKLRWIHFVVLWLASVTTFAAHADMRQYGGTLTNSVWALSEDTRLQCQLAHIIPNYGEALFTSTAGKLSNLSFELDMRRLPADYSLASVESVPPSWRPGTGSKPITEMQWRKQFNGDLDERSAWVMLTELEKGYFPTLYYSDWHNKSDRVSVALSATNFRAQYYEFLSCIDALLKYSFDDIAYTQLTFENNSSELDKASKAKLRRIEEYLKHDKNIEGISVKAFSSSWGGRYTNLKVSQKRASMVKDFFVKFGIGQDKISTEGFGEKRHIASNQTELGRAENRRVVIEMVKP